MDTLMLKKLEHQLTQLEQIVFSQNSESTSQHDQKAVDVQDVEIQRLREALAKSEYRIEILKRALTLHQ
jgi:hypothetical protein